MISKFSEEIGLLRLANVSFSDMADNNKAIEIGKSKPIENNVFTWFLPPVTHALKGGVRTVFMFAQHFTETWGALNHFVIYSYGGHDIDTAPLCQSLRQNFPNLRFTVSVFRNGIDDVKGIPASNASFATLWTTAYLQLKYNNTSRKFYLVQDYEPNFYPSGAVFGAIEQTYRFGFSCIANTEGVGNKCKQYNSDVTIFTPGVDKTLFYADSTKTGVGKPARIVFYGRPSNPRNCFITGIQTLRAVKRKLGDTVELISVGENWEVDDYGVKGIVDNWGLLSSMEEVAALYRSADLGLVYMMTPHPSYQPPEYMASGCVTVTNINESNSWLLNDNNSLLVEPVPEIAAQRIHDLLKDGKSWQAKRNAGIGTSNNLNWEVAFDCIKTRLLKIGIN